MLNVATHKHNKKLFQTVKNYFPFYIWTNNCHWSNSQQDKCIKKVKLNTTFSGIFPREQQDLHYPGARFNKKKVFTLEGWRCCYVQQGGIIMR